MNHPDDIEERICIVAEGCNISYEEAENKVMEWVIGSARARKE